VTTKTTIRLRLSLRDRLRIHAARYHSAAVGVAIIAILLYARMLLNGSAAPEATTVQPTPAVAPIILIATQPAIVPPTALPAAPQVIYITLPTPEPQVIYVEVAPVIVQDAPPAIEAPAVATPEPVYVTEPQLQTLIIPEDEEMSPALLREAQDR